MIMRLTRVTCFLLLVGFILYTSCDLTDPSHLDRPPVLKHYIPEAGYVTAFLEDTVTFAITAEDPDGSKIKQYFYLGDSLVSVASSWNYIVEDTGMITVKGMATDGGRPLEVRWELERLKPENLPPVIVLFEPPELNPVIIIGNELNFTILAEDPESEPLTYFYKIADSVVSTSRHYAFLATSIGNFGVTAYVTDSERFRSKSWQVRVTDYPDTISPAKVEILSLETGTEPGELFVDWIAVGEDSMEGIPSYYRVRTSTIPIIDEFTWERASDRPGEPAPAAPGEVMEMTIRDLIPAEFVYVSVRAVDEYGNISPLSDSPGASVKGMEIFGELRDALTNEPIEGARVSLEGYTADQDTTDANGLFDFLELPIYSGKLIISDEGDPQEYGAYFDYHQPYTVTHGEILQFWLLPNIQLDTQLYPEFLNFFRHMTDTFTHPFGNILRTWEIPVDIYVPPFVNHDLDYEATIKGILDEFEALTNIDFFDIVDGPPDVGVLVKYDPDIDRDKYRVTQWSPGMQFPIKGEISFRTSYTASTPTAFEKIIRHEVGHALGMKHSIDENHIMWGGAGENPAIVYITQDELRLLLCMYRLPRGMTLPWVKWD